ncbi:adenylate kinase isoenzyme 5-like [Anneissia japonica]|uniref:adenylate kinase isoenzyme 5-like n=1 Tax=Anneissia japonica TaxID=1529436 RepID=UPI001425B22A|nr:adenylate kinase isoenzyme 5-like [Anneissia japonica]
MTSREKTKTYLAKKEIPQLFESMMTGLMYFKPENHLEYLQECITKAKDSDGRSLQWNTFVEDQVQMRKTSPLPPITSEPLERQPTFATEPSLLDLKTTSPLPPIASINRSQNLQHIFVIGGPGSGKALLCEKLGSRYAEYHHVSVGQMIRDKISASKEDDAHMSNLKSIVAKGQLLSEYGHPDLLLYLECDEQILRYRLEKRRAINKREDDTAEATESRLSIFLKNTPCLFEQFPDDIKKLPYDISL